MEEIEIDINKINQVFIDDDGSKGEAIMEVIKLLDKYKGDSPYKLWIKMDYGDFLKIAKSYLDLVYDLGEIQDAIYGEEME